MTKADTPAEYVKERNEALMDFATFITFAEKYGKFPLPRKEVLEISFHQLRTAARSLKPEARSESKRWLLQRNYMPWDDGDVLV